MRGTNGGGEILLGEKVMGRERNEWREGKGVGM